MLVVEIDMICVKMVWLTPYMLIFYEWWVLSCDEQILMFISNVDMKVINWHDMGWDFMIGQLWWENVVVDEQILIYKFELPWDWKDNSLE